MIWRNDVCIIVTWEIDCKIGTRGRGDGLLDLTLGMHSADRFAALQGTQETFYPRDTRRLRTLQSEKSGILVTPHAGSRGLGLGGKPTDHRLSHHESINDRCIQFQSYALHSFLS
jgi:hypothetical protein